MKSSALIALGLALGIAIAFAFPDGMRKGIWVGVALASALEWLSHRRRIKAIQPSATQAEFAVAMASGFLLKLVALIGFGFLAHLNDLFAVPAFMLAFVATVLWGETCMVLLLSRVRPQATSQENSPSSS